ncbi:peptidyl-prolyl cis-trans isomerase [Flavobacteriaceae bacterium]|nr:peptidyl-prolyl cis-trans isomerase [Flavobacteriaceae bacterium]
MLNISCDKWIPDNQEVLARVGTQYLYKENLNQIIGSFDSESDSIIKARNFIDLWARNQILLQKAKVNLSKQEIENLNQLINDYRLDLYGNAYRQSIASKNIDTIVSISEVDSFLNQNREIFKLRAPLYQVRYIHLPLDNVDQNEIQLSFQRFNTEDKDFLDSLSFQYNNYILSDSLWISRNSLKSRVLFLNQNNFDNYIKKSEFFKITDTLGVYLFLVNKILEKGDLAPLEVSTPTIKNIVLNQRKLKFIKQFEKNILQDAIKSKTYEMY